MSNPYKGPSIDASYHVSDHLAKRFQRRIKKISQSERKSRLWWPCLFTDRDEMSNLYRGPSIDASYKVSVHLAKRFQRRFLKIGQSETRITCGGHVCLRIGTK
jgi:copper oxidase (laccase) domain-containing protein